LNQRLRAAPFFVFLTAITFSYRHVSFYT
jgi:hypothetical protein